MSFSTPANVCIERSIDIQQILNRVSNDDFDASFEIVKTIEWIEGHAFEKICLQLPDHLLKHSVRLCRRLKESLNGNVYVLADTTYNSCCIDEVAARHIGADCIIHYGHSCLSPTVFPVLLIHDRILFDLDRALVSLKSVDVQPTLLVYDVSLQYMADLINNRFFQEFPTLLITEIIDGSDCTKPSKFSRQIVNREGIVQDVKNFEESHLVFMGSEGPTLYNLTVASKAKEIYHLNPKDYTVSPYSQSQWFKRRRFLIEKCKDVKNIGILVCTLSMKNFNAIILRMKKIIRSSGKKCYVLTVGKPNVAKLANLSEIEMFVLVACPENDLYNSKDFLSPIIYPYELELALNNQRDQYEMNYSTDFNELLPNGENYSTLQENGFQQEPDVSLISGKMRNIEIGNHNYEVNSEDGQLNPVLKEQWALQELGIGKSLSERSWKGLEQDLDNSKVELATIGRKGIASTYVNEPF